MWEKWKKKNVNLLSVIVFLLHIGLLRWPNQLEYTTMSDYQHVREAVVTLTAVYVSIILKEEWFKCLHSASLQYIQNTGCCMYTIMLWFKWKITPWKTSCLYWNIFNMLNGFGENKSVNVTTSIFLWDFSSCVMLRHHWGVGVGGTTSAVTMAII